MTENVPKYVADDLELFELLRIVWRGKGTVALVAAFFVILSGAYALWFPTVYSGELVFSGPKPEVLSKFTLVNNVSAINKKPIMANGQVVGYEDIVSADTLIQGFISEFNDYDELRDAVRKYSKEYSQFSGDDDERNLLLVEQAKRFEIIPASDENPRYVIRFETEDKQEALSILKQALSEISSNLSDGGMAHLRNLRDGLSNKNMNSLDILQKQLEALKDSIDIEVRRQKIFLKEQAEIARELGVASNVLDAKNLSRVNAVSVNVGLESPYYLRGYKAIEKELQLLEARDGEEVYLLSEEYGMLLKELGVLRANNVVEEMDKAIKHNPFNESSGLVLYDLDLIDFEAHKKVALVFGVALIFGILVGIGWVLVHHRFRAYGSDLAN